MTYQNVSAVLTTLTLMLYSSTPVYCQTLPGTAPLTIPGKIAEQLVEGVDRFLLTEIESSIGKRSRHWQRDFSSPGAYSASVQPNRDRLAYILGVRDERVPLRALEFVTSTETSHLVGEGEGYKVYAVRWPVFHDVHGEGLWLVPNETPRANVIALPDADQSPEMICGLQAGLPAGSQFARQLAAGGCQVLVPTLISREFKPRNGRAQMTNREYLYRSAFVLGRHLIGYEVQKVSAAVDWMTQRQGVAPAQLPLGIIGNGEGGMLSLYASALDPRVDVTCVAGYFGSRQEIWQQPISRNVFGLLEEFGDAEVASLIAPRKLVVDGNGAPTIDLPSQGGAPAVLRSPSNEEVAAELARLVELTKPLSYSPTHVPWDASRPQGVSVAATVAFFDLLTQGSGESLAIEHADLPNSQKEAIADVVQERHQRQFLELEQHNEWQLQQSASIRRGFMNLGSDRSDAREGRFKLDTSSAEAYQRSIEPYREHFRQETIGHFDLPLMEFNARSRVVYDQPTWTGYEVVLDVFPDVIAYGILCLPKGMAENEKRPVVVCQHGLEGRPQDTITGDHSAYHDFAAKLAERGYITFAPQNLYLGEDVFRTLQRKANSIKKTLFSVIVPQHQQIVNWLKTQPNVDPQRIAFYGLSYGGKSAMRIPPLVPDYCLSICSADFNDWVDKNATTRENYSYVWTGEYEIFEFDLGTTFNYAEMAALIAPRPFMVERGHFDTVGVDERVAFEFAKVRYLYSARLGLPDHCEIEWFVGPHTIHGQGTFDFLDRHLKFSGK